MTPDETEMGCSCKEAGTDGRSGRHGDRFSGHYPCAALGLDGTVATKRTEADPMLIRLDLKKVNVAWRIASADRDETDAEELPDVVDNLSGANNNVADVQF